MYRVFVVAIALVILVGLLALRPADRAVRVGSGFTAHVLCSLVFHTGLEPKRAFDDYIAAVLGPASVLLDYDVDRDARSVTSKGLWAQARAIWRDEVGCTLVADADEAALRRARFPTRNESIEASRWPDGHAALSDSARRELDAAIEAAFAEPEGPGRKRQTLAVVAIHEGRLVAERYAPGLDASTPLLSWSMAKSVTAALIGVAVEEGRFSLDAPAPVPEWRADGDPRGALTLDHLLRMSSGLEFDEYYGAINDVSVMLFTRADTGAFAADKPLDHEPDAFWSYSSGTSNILARVLRDAFGGDTAAMLRWSRERFFDRVGMSSAVFEVDASGSFIGSSFVFATARDWARFGQVHLSEGVWDGDRVLPADWARYVSTPTPRAERGRYGAHWWLNAGSPDRPEDRDWPSLPRDAYAARGMSGQYVVVVPSHDLVVVRLGLAQAEGDDLHGIEPLVGGVISALGR